ncbi:MAG: glycosyltransferase family 2 protein [Psychromonas sp.]|nr:glycosyltransferase family 2 protein [Psychromonas sp.]
MKSTPLVSIVIPCYQQQDLLLRALNSVAKQHYDNIEVIVVDDGSEPPIVINWPQFDFTVKNIRQENKGLSNARNTGLSKASGKYIKFLDADDKLLPNCIEDQVNSLPDNNHFISVIGYIEHQEETQCEYSVIPAFTDGLSALLLVNIGPPHAFLYTTQSVNSIGGFYEGDRVDGGHEDYDLLFRLMISGMSLISVHKNGVIYYKRAGSMSTIKRRMDRTLTKVWIYNVRQLCRQQVTLSQTLFLSLLTGYCHLIEITSPECLAPILEIEAEIIEYLIHFMPKTLDAELSLLTKRFSLTNRVPKLVSMISLTNSYTDNPILINNQEINNCRVNLMQYNSVNSTLEQHYSIHPTLDWLQEILSAVACHEGSIAVYGAGDFGRKIVTLLCTINRHPIIIFDRNHNQFNAINNIEVVSPDNINNYDLALVIVASLLFRSEILSKLDAFSLFDKV